MMAIMLITLLAFFKFVVDTGLLIQAKINLQNAADLAAYAGASVQARQLNHVGYLNYEMRRQLKKFLFRYYVLGNIQQKSQPYGSIADQTPTRSWNPDPSDSNAYDVPTVCLAFSAQNNYCQLRTLQPIPVNAINVSPLDPTNTILLEQAKTLESIRQGGCLGIQALNKLVLTTWLYNTDTTLDGLAEELGKAGGDPEMMNNVSFIKSIASGLGLFPKELLLSFRILTLESYLNDPRRSMTIDTAQTLEQTEIAKHERSLQAFYSALYTLGDQIFDERSIQLDELIPSGADYGESDQSLASSIVNFVPLKTSFDTWYVYYPGLKGAPSRNATACIGQPGKISVRDLPIGFYKNPEVLTYYAVKLQATANLMYWPRGGKITLRAYSAARPFGSRIGPILKSSPEVGIFSYLKTPNFNGDTNVQNLSCSDGPGSGGKCKGIPNIAISENEKDDALTDATGWNRVEVIRAFSDGLVNTSSSSGTYNTITLQNVKKAYQLAMAPNPAEKGHYIIPFDAPDLPANTNIEYIQHFPDVERRYSFWAPLFPDSKGSPAAKLKETLEKAKDNVDPSDPSRASFEAVIQAMGVLLDRYLALLEKGQGEENEGLHVMRLVDPSYTRPEGGAPASRLTLSSAPNLILKDSDYKTSFSQFKDDNASQVGRTGYSVKFVSFESLTSKKVKARGAPGSTSGDASSDWQNDLPADADLRQLKH